MSTSSWTNLLDLIYPIHSVYISVDQSTTPAELFGGTWTLLNKEACLRSSVPDEESDLNNGFHLYGADTFKLDVSQLPPHKHCSVDTQKIFNVGAGVDATVPSNAAQSAYTNNDGYSMLTGSNIFSTAGKIVSTQLAISRVPKYVECFVYRRTA